LIDWLKHKYLYAYGLIVTGVLSSVTVSLPHQVRINELQKE